MAAPGLIESCTKLAKRSAEWAGNTEANISGSYIVFIVAAMPR